MENARTGTWCVLIRVICLTPIPYGWPQRGQLQRNYVWRFIELCNAGLSVDEIKRQVMEPEEVAIDYQI